MKIFVSVDGKPELNFNVEGVGPKFWSGTVVWSEKHNIMKRFFGSRCSILWRLQKYCANLRGGVCLR